jgi:hypothetical protein
VLAAGGLYQALQGSANVLKALDLPLHDAAGRKGRGCTAFKPQACTPIAGQLHPMQAVSADVQADQRLRLGLEKRDQRIKLNLKNSSMDNQTPFNNTKILFLEFSTSTLAQAKSLSATAHV